MPYQGSSIEILDTSFGRNINEQIEFYQHFGR